MNVLVTGGLGYIGSHVVVELLAAGHKVIVYDNLSTGVVANAQLASTLVRADIMEYKKLVAVMKDWHIGAVIHLAAKKAVGESMERPEFYAHQNIVGSVALMNAMVEAGVKKLVFSSSAVVYDVPPAAGALITEDVPVAPLNFYGFTKSTIESLFPWYDRLKGIKCVSLRYFNAAGYDAEGRVKGLEKNPQNLLPIIMEVLCGKRPGMEVFGNDYPTPDGTPVRDYIHPTDLARAHIKALELEESATLNLGTGKGASVLEVIGAAERVAGRKVNHTIVARRPGDPAFLVAGTARAEKLLGWKAERSSLENIVSTMWNIYSLHASAPSLDFGKDLEAEDLE